MGELAEFKFITAPFIEAKTRIEHTTNAATMYALRATGRKIIARAKESAPEYPGSQNQSAYPDTRAQSEAGQLRRSIHNGKEVERVGGRYQLRVGVMAPPKGKRGAVFYSKQTEGMYGYMARAFAEGNLAEEYRKALAVGFAKYR